MADEFEKKALDLMETISLTIGDDSYPDFEVGTAAIARALREAHQSGYESALRASKLARGDE